MIRARRLWALLALMAVLLGTAATAVDAPPRPKIRVGTFSDSNFQNMDDYGQYSGYGYEYLQEIAKYAGWEYEYIYASWEECLNMLQEGELDLMGSVPYTSSLAETLAFAQLESGIRYTVLCTSAGNTDLAYDDFDAFEGMTVGVLSVETGDERLAAFCRDNGFSVKTRTYATQEALLEALQDGEVDTILTSNLRKGSKERIVARFSPTPFYFATTKDNHAVLDGLNNAQSQIKLADPHFDADLYDKFYAVDTHDKPIFTQSERAFISDAPPLRVVYLAQWRPVSQQERTGAFAGITADFFESVQEYTGLSFTYVPAKDTEEALSLLASGQADLLSAFQKDYIQAEKHGLSLTIPYLSMPTVMVASPTTSSKSPRHLAMTADYLPSFQNKLLEKNLSIVYYPTVKDCFDALRDSKVAYAYTDSYSANLLRTDYRYAQFSATNISDAAHILCVAMPQAQDIRLISIFNKVIQYVSSHAMQEMIVANTVIPQKLTLRDIIYQRPVTTVLLVTGGFCAILFLVVYIYFLKTRNSNKIYNLQFMDELTGIWNFNKFQTEAEKLLLSGRPYAMVYSDIERFKFFNDLNGYATGDLVLKMIALSLKKYTGSDEMFARVSADKFIALLKFTDADALLDRLKLVNSKINTIPKNQNELYRVSLACGIYVVQPGDKNVSAVIDCANEARKTIKGAHKSSAAFYSDQLKAQILAEREIGELMETALREKQFVPFYQPKFDLKTERIVGSEALVRWFHPERGLIPPIAFVPIFEKNGFIIDMDFYVFDCVCRDLRVRLDEGRPVVRVSSNFSRLHLHRPDFSERLMEITRRYAVPPALLELEITESAVQEDAPFLAALLGQLKALGFSIAMDDFGTGYSSLNLLKELPVDTLKLDKDFLQKGLSDKKERIVIEGFVSIAEKLEMEVVCEGVETREQAVFLENIGCDTAQGYLYAKPMPLEDYEKLLDEQTHLIR